MTIVKWKQIRVLRQECLLEPLISLETVCECLSLSFYFKVLSQLDYFLRSSDVSVAPNLSYFDFVNLRCPEQIT